MLCPLCGAESEAERRSCSNCGAMLVTAHHTGEDSRPYREVIVFTGKLSVRRDKVAAAVAAAHWEVAANVNARDDAGSRAQDPKQLVEGYGKSTKERKADELIASGYKIRIIDETEFWSLLQKSELA